MDYTFGELLKGFRKRAGMSQPELARALKRSRTTVSNWERGETVPEDREVVLQIAEELLLKRIERDDLLKAAGYLPDLTADYKLAEADKQSGEHWDHSAERTALVVEDVGIHQAAMKHILLDLGIRCEVVESINDALTNIRSRKYDLITLDMQLDPMDSQGQGGLLLLDQIQLYQRGVPTIIVSGLNWNAVDVRNFFVHYEAFDFFSKPFQPKDLIARVKAVLSRSPRETQ